jgi:phage gp36-like protein
MAYASRDDLVKRYGAEIEGLERAEGKGPVTVEAALRDAAAEIDGHIGRRYRLPLPGGGAGFSVLVWLSCDIARFRLWESHIEDGQDSSTYVRYRKAAAFLEAIADGKAVLVDDAGREPEQAAAAGPAAVAAPRPRIATNRLMRMMDYGS